MGQLRFSESGLVGLDKTREELGLTEEKTGFSFWNWLDRKIEGLL